MIANLKFLLIKEWWDQVIVAPDESKITEFSKGIPIGSKALIPSGGHASPNSILGEILLWKKAQKNLMKNIISDKINTIILYFSNFMVVNECLPCREDSRLTSRHHKIIPKNGIAIIIRIEKIIILKDLSEQMNIVAEYKRNIDIKIGQGLGFGRWNGFLIFDISEFR